MWIKYCFLAIIGLCGGTMVCAGLFAFIVALGLVNKLASNLGQAANIKLFEYMVILGSIIWNVVYFFSKGLYGGYLLIIIIGLFFGIYVGVLSLALAEVTKVMPILTMRINWHRGIRYIIVATAVGKVIGSLISLCK